MRRIEVLLLAALSMTVINDAAAQSAPPRTKTVPDFVDHRRLPGSGAAEDTAPSSAQLDKAAAASAEEEKKRLANELEAEAKRKADDEKRLAAEAEAKRKADDEKRLAAEAKRKADEEKRLAAEAEAKRKADDEKRLAAEAERVRNAENALKRRAADVEILVEESKKKRAAETGNTAALPGAEQQKSLASEATKCPTPVIQSRPLAGGIAMVEISAPCQAGKPVVIHYEGLASNLTIGTDGNLSAALDLIFGPEPGAMVEIEGFAPAKISLAGLDLDKVSKTAVLWTSPVNVDLHAFEYASIAGAPGHLWQGNPSASADASAQSKADGLGHGFLSRLDDGQRAGSKVEVYTFLHSPGQTRGVVTFGLDFESRGATPEGENCGDGSNAQLAFETVVRSPNGSIRRESGIIPSAKCGVPLSAAARRNAGAIPDLRLNR